MTDKQMLLQILRNQSKKGVKSGDWEDVSKPRMEKDKIALDSVEVGFCFSKRGRLLGIFNWKE